MRFRRSILAPPKWSSRVARPLLNGVVLVSLGVRHRRFDLLLREPAVCLAQSDPILADISMQGAELPMARPLRELQPAG